MSVYVYSYNPSKFEMQINFHPRTYLLYQVGFWMEGCIYSQVSNYFQSSHKLLPCLYSCNHHYEAWFWTLYVIINGELQGLIVFVLQNRKRSPVKTEVRLHMVLTNTGAPL